MSRQFVEASSNQLRVLCERRLEDLNLVVLMIDGIHFGGQVLVVALGIAESGEKYVGSVARSHGEHHGGQRAVGRSWWTADWICSGGIWWCRMDRKRYEPVWNAFSVNKWKCSVARFTSGAMRRSTCQEPPERLRPVDAQCLAMNNYAEAKEALQKIFPQLERINPSAARSLEEGLEETLTVHRLGVGAVLRRKLATTNPIESCLSTVQRVARNVKRWREGNQPLRWTATGLLEAEKKFRLIKGFQEILLLKDVLNPSRIQQKEVRIVEVA